MKNERVVGFGKSDINIRNVNVFLTNATATNALVSRTCPCVFFNYYLHCVFPSRAEYKQVDRLRKNAHARALGA